MGREITNSTVIEENHARWCPIKQKGQIACVFVVDKPTVSLPHSPPI